MQKFVYVLVLLASLACTKKMAVSTTVPAATPTTTVTAAPAATSSATLDLYAGSFKMESNEYVQKVNVVVKDGTLALATDKGDTAPLKATAKADVFTANIQGYDAEISFARTAGSVSGIKISVGGGAVVLSGAKEN